MTNSEPQGHIFLSHLYIKSKFEYDQEIPQSRTAHMWQPWYWVPKQTNRQLACDSLGIEFQYNQ